MSDNSDAQWAASLTGRLRQQEQERREQAEREKRWATIIRSPTSYDSQILKATAVGLRSIIGNDALTAMDLVCEAIRAGAFGGTGWLKWRLEVANYPDVQNAVGLLKSAPEEHQRKLAAMLHLPDACKIIADLIETFTPVSPPDDNQGSGGDTKWFSSRWFTKNTNITSEQLRQAKFQGKLRAKKEKGQNLYLHGDAIRIWGEDALEKALKNR